MKSTERLLADRLHVGFDNEVVEYVPSGTDMFAMLGEPGNEGKAFAITRLCMADTGLTPATFPKPDYEHGIWLDTFTDNYLVLRPDAAGKYWDGLREGLQRIR